MTSQLPAHLQQYQAPDIAGALSATLGSAMPPHVSIEGGRFTLIDAGNNEIPVPTFDPTIGVYLDAAIIDVNKVMSRLYYPDAYDNQAQGKRPECFSDNGIGPSTAASSPQAPTCAACPRSEWTKVNPNGKKVPWCTQKQKIALLIPGFPTLFLLAVPPNSHSYLREYVEKCKGNGANIADLITRISFVPNVQGTLQFSPMSYIDAPTAQLRQAAYVERKTDALVGRTDVARPAGTAIAAAAQQAALPSSAQLQGQAGATPFVQPSTAPATIAAWPAANGQTQAAPAFETANPGAATASPSDPVPTQRKRRRTAAEMAQANGVAPAGQASQQPAASPQAPFPHPGQTTQPAAAQGNFGIAQPAAAGAEVQGMLDNFFGKQG